MFPFRKKQPTRLEKFKQSLPAPLAAGVDHLAAHVPVEKLESTLKSARTQVGGAANVAGDAASHALHDAANALQEAAHSVQHAVSGTAHTVAHLVSARLAEMEAGAKARAAAETAGDTARQAADAARGTATTVGGYAGEHAANVAGRVKESVQELAARARDLAADTRETLEDRRDAAASQGAQAAQVAAEAAREKKDEAEAALAAATAEGKMAAAGLVASLASKFGALKGEAASAAADLGQTAASEAEAHYAQAVDSAREAGTRLKQRAAELPTPHISWEDPAEIQIAQGRSRLLWIIAGVALGAVLALLFAPTSGRRSRAAIKNRLGKVRQGATETLEEAAESAAQKASELKERAEGMAQTLEKKKDADLEPGDLDDATITDRVHSSLGHLPELRGLGRLNINTEQGVVTLRGPFVAEEARAAIEKTVAALPGVRGVKAEFAAEETPEKAAADAAPTAS